MATKYKFRVVHGRHHEDGKTHFKGGNGVESPHGDTFWTTNDLRKHNYPGSKKFDLLKVAEDGEEAADESPPFVNTDTDDDTAEVDLASMTVAQLRDFAAGEEIDLTGLTRKEDILKTIHDALDADA